MQNPAASTPTDVVQNQSTTQLTLPPPSQSPFLCSFSVLLLQGMLLEHADLLPQVNSRLVCLYLLYRHFSQQPLKENPFFHVFERAHQVCCFCFDVWFSVIVFLFLWHHSLFLLHLAFRCVEDATKTRQNRQTTGTHPTCTHWLSLLSTGTKGRTPNVSNWRV